ncbi:MAG: hypothetical protein ACTSVB_07875 [Candidatus Heimdallarchaeaceae archaeon]
MKLISNLDAVPIIIIKYKDGSVGCTTIDNMLHIIFERFREK